MVLQESITSFVSACCRRWTFRDDLAGVPLSEPEAFVVPARRLADHETLQRDLRLDQP